jgi:hypothetical protein
MITPESAANDSNATARQPERNDESQNAGEQTDMVKTAPANNDSSGLLEPSQQNETDRPNQIPVPAKKYPFEPASRILKERKINGRTEYLVLIRSPAERMGR